jgi:putative heme iron utilization protein
MTEDYFSELVKIEYPNWIKTRNQKLPMTTKNTILLIEDQEDQAILFARIIKEINKKTNTYTKVLIARTGKDAILLMESL